MNMPEELALVHLEFLRLSHPAPKAPAELQDTFLQVAAELQDTFLRVAAGRHTLEVAAGTSQVGELHLNRKISISWFQNS